MDKAKEPVLGEYTTFGNQFKVYTMRGWIICDDWSEVEEELEIINTMKDKVQ